MFSCLYEGFPAKRLTPVGASCLGYLMSHKLWIICRYTEQCQEARCCAPCGADSD